MKHNEPLRDPQKAVIHAAVYIMIVSKLVITMYFS